MTRTDGPVYVRILLAQLPSRCAAWRAGCPSVAEQLGSSRDLAIRRVIELHATQEARSLVEFRYLDGHPALCPDSARGWEEQVAATERLAVMAERLAERDGAPPASLDLPDAVAARVPAVVADFAEPSKVTALEKLGQGIARSGLRPAGSEGARRKTPPQMAADACRGARKTEPRSGPGGLEMRGYLDRVELIEPRTDDQSPGEDDKDYEDRDLDDERCEPEVEAARWRGSRRAASDGTPWRRSL